MNCGSRDFVCYVLGLLASHGVELSNFGKLIPWLGELITNHAQAIIGLLGFSFGVWKWWRFHDRVLHKRLREYLRAQDVRISQARSYITEALHRPGPERKFAEPLFALRPLRKVLSRRNWEPLIRFTRLESSAEKQLDKALNQLNNRLDAAERQLRTLRHQQASAHFLKGAIASARSGHQRSSALSNQLDYRSLDAFQAALQVPGHEKDIELREFEAHQLLRLGHVGDAEQRLENLGKILEDKDANRVRDLALARVRRMEAVVAQAGVIVNGGSGCLAAHVLLGSGANPGAASALMMRKPYAPFHDKWDAIEQADLHYLAAFFCRKSAFTNLERQHLGAAETEYRRVRDSLNHRSWRGRAEKVRAITLCDVGLDRILAARGAGGREPRYDEAWLLPPLQPLERPATGKGDGGGDKTVQQAAKKSDVDDPGKT